MLQKIETHDLTNDQLQESYWIVTHWKKIERIIVRSLIGINAVLFLFTLGFVVKIYLIDASATESFIQSLKSFAVVNGTAQPLQELTMEVIAVLPHEDGRVDVVARVTNPYTSFRAHFDTVFMSKGDEIGRVPSFIYPGETKYVLGLSLPSSSEVTAASSELYWKRMAPSDARTLSERKAFRVEDFALSAADGVSRATFSITNTSVHNFWNVRIPVVLLSSNQVIAAQSVTLEHLDSDEKKRVQVSWYQDIRQPSSYVIEPEVDVFDDSAYRTKKAPLQRLR